MCDHHGEDHHGDHENCGGHGEGHDSCGGHCGHFRISARALLWRAQQSEGIAKKRRARQGQSIEKLCFARAEDFSYKGAGERAEQWGKKKSATWTACTACIRIASTSGR